MRRLHRRRSEDIEQELLLRLWEAKDSFDPQLSHPRGFITTVVERAAATMLWNQKAHKRGSQVGSYLSR
jgi:DNA-directed RNA polymerase specialized sigma24 family protein